MEFFAMSEQIHQAKKEPEEVPMPDCPYCGQVGGVSQYDTICEQHDSSQAIGWVTDGKFFPAKKP